MGTRQTLYHLMYCATALRRQGNRGTRRLHSTCDATHSLMCLTTWSLALSTLSGDCGAFRRQSLAGGQWVLGVMA